ncbi:MAG: hypothetical protein WBQ24_20950 [Xanthobacteraceae bacterium]
MTRIGLRLMAVHPGFLLALGLVFAGTARAQTAEIDALKGKIFDAKMAQQTFAGGLAHCKELDGTNFYFRQRDRILNLEEYHHSLESLARQGVFNPETKRPWNEEDAIAKWEQVKKQATDDKDNCALVTSLPDLQKRLDDLQKQAAAQGKQGIK